MYVSSRTKDKINRAKKKPRTGTIFTVAFTKINVDPQKYEAKTRKRMDRYLSLEMFIN